MNSSETHKEQVEGREIVVRTWRTKFYETTRINNNMTARIDEKHINHHTRCENATFESMCFVVVQFRGICVVLGCF